MKTTELEVWIEIARQVPSLVVMAGLVVYVFRYLERVGTQSEQRMERVIQDYRADLERSAALFERVVEALAYFRFSGGGSVVELPPPAPDSNTPTK